VILQIVTEMKKKRGPGLLLAGEAFDGSFTRFAVMVGHGHSHIFSLPEGKCFRSN
jgi:hypothetical protein